MKRAPTSMSSEATTALSMEVGSWTLSYTVNPFASGWHSRVSIEVGCRASSKAASGCSPVVPEPQGRQAVTAPKYLLTESRQGRRQAHQAWGLPRQEAQCPCIVKSERVGPGGAVCDRVGGGDVGIDRSHGDGDLPLWLAPAPMTSTMGGVGAPHGPLRGSAQATMQRQWGRQCATAHNHRR
jgi:hypothetical protein